MWPSYFAFALPPPGARVARVLPDVAGIDREFDYWVPERFGPLAGVGCVVRVDLAGRRVRGWVSAEGVEPPGASPSSH